MLLTVSINVSPLLTEEDDAAKFIMSADKRFSANSKDSLVRVEFSKNILAIVMLPFLNYCLSDNKITLSSPSCSFQLTFTF